uniref:Putative harbinger transposase-derived nuclease domain-containing protein n=1 Tax=Helianthus annuus TaxID=4232 RepID=A0A251VEJ0_HELAN
MEPPGWNRSTRKVVVWWFDDSEVIIHGVMRAPRRPKETFNYHYSSLRNIIERIFGVWKARWALLRDMHVNYTYEHQAMAMLLTCKAFLLLR